MALLLALFCSRVAPAGAVGRGGGLAACGISYAQTYLLTLSAPYFVSVLLASTVSQRSRGEPTFSLILTHGAIALTRPFRTASLGQVRIGNVARMVRANDVYTKLYMPVSLYFSYMLYMLLTYCHLAHANHT